MLGLDHADDGLMAPVLDPGVRLLAEVNDALLGDLVDALEIAFYTQN